MKGRITNRHSSNQEMSVTMPQQSTQSFSLESVCQSDRDLIRKLGSSVGSDSGIDHTDVEAEPLPVESDHVVIQKTKTGRRRQNKKKKNPISLENNNPDENILSFDSERVIESRNPNKSEVTPVGSERGSEKTKPRNRKSNKSPICTRNIDYDGTTPECINGNPKKICGTINNENETDDKENSNNNQNQNKPGANSGEKSKKKKSGGKKSHNNNTGLDGSTEGANYPLLNFNDAVLPVTVPRAWHHYNGRGYWSLSREALAQEMVMLGKWLIRTSLMVVSF